MFNIQGFYKIKSIVNCGLHKEKIKTYLLSQSVKGTVISPALDTLNKFLQERKKFDLVFVDADKGNYKNYYELSLNLINEKALIIFDNVLWHGNVFKNTVTDKQTDVMKEFNKYIKDDNRVDKVILPLGDGLTICRKI